MVHCRSPTKCLKNGHFPSNQIQIVPDSNCCKLFMDNGLPAGANFSPDTSDKEHRPKANKKRRRTNMQKKAAFPCHLKATVPCGRIYGSKVERIHITGLEGGIGDGPVGDRELCWRGRRGSSHHRGTSHNQQKGK